MAWIWWRYEKSTFQSNEVRFRRIQSLQIFIPIVVILPYRVWTDSEHTVWSRICIFRKKTAVTKTLEFATILLQKPEPERLPWPHLLQVTPLPTGKACFCTLLFYTTFSQIFARFSGSFVKDHWPLTDMSLIFFGAISLFFFLKKFLYKGLLFVLTLEKLAHYFESAGLLSWDLKIQNNEQIRKHLKTNKKLPLS